MPPLRRYVLPALAAGLSLLVADLAARISLAVLDRTRGLEYRPIVTKLTTDAESQIRRFAAGREFLMPDSDLGWVPRLGASMTGYHVSPQGLRAKRMYDTLPRRAGVLRVAAFGDSFVYGDEIGDRVTWAAQLEQRGLEVLNFGVPAYGFDQSLLRYIRDGRVFHPRVVIIGVYADDVNRGLNVWRPFLTGEFGIPSAKPRFRLADSLILMRNPLPSPAAYAGLLAHPESVLTDLGSNDHFFRSRERASAWDVSGLVRLTKLMWRIRREREEGSLRGTVLRPDDEGTRLAVAVLGRFVRQVRADGAEPLLIPFPDRFLHERYRRTGVRADAALVAGLPGVPVIDLYPLLGPSDFAPYGHLSPGGAKKVAAAILRYLHNTGTLPLATRDSS
jgi:hypothetical protein